MDHLKLIMTCQDTIRLQVSIFKSSIQRKDHANFSKNLDSACKFVDRTLRELQEKLVEFDSNSDFDDNYRFAL